MKKPLLLSAALLAACAVSAQSDNVEVKTGQFSPQWESLDAWQCPEWFKDAKFGIWAHWGPQCQAEDGDWYARFMYYEGSGQSNYHFQHFGDPSVYGLKELCRDWKAENWNPEALVNLYKSAGARYFMALGNHHDNFDLWNSPYQEWNSVNIGPKKDLVKGWSDACKKAGLPLGVSIHASHAWTWLEPSQLYDGNLTYEDGLKPNADGTDKWWKGMNPQNLYAQKHEHSRGWDDSGTIHSQWDWGNGASLPSAEYKQMFQNRVLELINDYDPAMLYFDDTAMPFYGCDDAVGQNILAHYYNNSAEKNGGTPNVLVTGKQLTSDQKKHMLWDVERGIPDRIQEDYWQTCTCIGSWHYDRNVYNNNGYKSAQQVVDMLVDIVSKNGNLLLSIPVRADGTIDEKEQAIVEQIKGWMDVNSKSIYGTRPWKTFGEGPLAETSHSLSAQGFNEGNNYSSKDVAYAQRNDTLFATIMRWPVADKFTFASLSIASEYYSGKVASVELIGYGKVDYTESVEGLTVKLPGVKPNEIAPVFEITFGEMETVNLATIITAYEQMVTEMLKTAGYDTGKYNKQSIEDFLAVVEAQKAYTESSEANQKVAIATINEAYKNLKKNGKNQPGAPTSEENAENVTIEYLEEATNFSASTKGSRFGTPAYWTVENYYVEMNDPSKGVKNGIDGYTGSNCLSIGIWSGEDKEPYTCDLKNARIYRKVTLEPGRYFFGPKFESMGSMSDEAWIYVADAPLTSDEVEEKAIAFAPIKGGQTGNFYGVTFTIKEEKEVVLAFQANMTTGSSQQEFRISHVKMLSYGNMDYEALEALYYSADQLIATSKVNSNTGYFRKDAVAKLQDAMEAAMKIDDSATYEEFMEAYNTLQAAIDDFLENGRNVGGAPSAGWIEDLTIEKLHEADNFKRTADTDDGDRFGHPLYWTVENFGFGDQGGIDHNPGYDCLHLEVWWNNNAYPENGYDIHNVRLYQKTHLPEGRYFFGAAYPTAEANDQLYIFASDAIVETSEISTKTIAYEKVKLAPADGTFRGIYFTLEEEQDVYLGWQADFDGVSTNNLRAKAVKLLSYGTIDYESVQTLIQTIEEECKSVKINANTGFYSAEAYAKLLAAIEEAKALDSKADFEEVSMAYNNLNTAYNDFKENGKNPGGQPDKMDATDLTTDNFVEATAFSRLDPSVTTRFATPKYWEVENFQIDNGGNGIKNGIDNYPGYNCLSLGIWDDRQNNAEGDIANARLFRTVNLPAGRYYFGAKYNTTYGMNPQAYIFASDAKIATDDIPQNSIAYYPINKASDEDGLFHGIYFTLDEQKDIILGWQANLSVGGSAQEFRAKEIVFYGYNVETDAIEEIPTENASDQTPHFYSLTGVELKGAPQHGIFVVRQGTKAYKVVRK